MKHASRERQERFIKNFEGVAGLDLDSALARCLRRDGLTWFTDEQIADLTSRIVDGARFSQRLRVRNRAVLRRAS